jgi:hypothetical protein
MTLIKKCKIVVYTSIINFRILFFNEFEPINPKIPMKKQTEDLRAGVAFEPRCVYDVLPVMKTTLSEKVSSLTLFFYGYKLMVLTIKSFINIF